MKTVSQKTNEFAQVGLILENQLEIDKFYCLFANAHWPDVLQIREGCPQDTLFDGKKRLYLLIKKYTKNTYSDHITQIKRRLINLGL
jgi:hypothetical protein